MKTAVDKVGRGKLRTINERFQAMCAHYLFEPDFCNVASGWEKGIVEKNVQDSRRRVWLEATHRRWSSLEELNAWLAQRCRDLWQELRHPEHAAVSVRQTHLASLSWSEESARLFCQPRSADGPRGASGFLESSH